MHCVPCGKSEEMNDRTKGIFDKSKLPPVVQEEEVQVENDGSKNATSKRPQTRVDVAV